MQKISAYILAFNEAEKIADAVSSVLWADEIVVADSGSTDRTAAIAQSLGARVVQLPFDGFGDLRNRAIAECRHEWIFSLDSDERCTAALLLDVDPVGLVRGRKGGPSGEGFALGQYVNDRPYAASSMLAVAMAKVFRTAMAGR